MNMYVKRDERKRRGGTSCLGCGIAAGVVLIGLVVIGGFLILNYLPSLSLQAAGFQPEGDTASVFQAAPTITMPEIVVVATLQPSEIVISAGDLGERTLDVPSGAVQIESGQVASNDGTTAQTQALRVTVDENGMLDICRQYSPICTPAGDGRLRNVMFDLRPGGAVVNGEFYIPQISTWQSAGVVMRLNESNRLEVMGVDVNGTLYSAPPGEMSEIVQEAETRANELLQQLVVQASGSSYTLQAISIDDATLTMLLQ
jgi:hypothetical protein